MAVLTRHFAGDQVLWLGLKLFLHDLVVTEVLVSVGWDAMPGQLAGDQVNHDVGKTLKVVATALLLEQVGVEAGKANSAHKVGLLAFRDMKACLWIDVKVAQAKIKQENQLLRVVVDFVALLLGQAFLQGSLVLCDVLEHEVLGFDVPVNHAALVDLFEA